MMLAGWSVLVVCAAVGPALAGQAGADIGWPTYHGDAGLTGVSRTVLPDKPVRLWRYRTEGSIEATPSAGDGRIYVATRAGRLSAVDMHGHKVWERTVLAPGTEGQPPKAAVFDAPTLYVDKTVVVGDRAGTLHAFDAATGADRWKYDAGGSIQGTASWAVSEKGGTYKVIVISQPNGFVHGVDLKRGKPLWEPTGPARCDGSPALGRGRVVFGSCAAAIHVYSSSTGRELHSIELGEGSEVAGGVAVDGDLVFTGSRSGVLSSVDLATKKVLWQTEPVGGEVFSTPAVGAEHVVFAASNGTTYCVRRKTGERLWEFAPERIGEAGSPVIAGERVIVSASGALWMLALASGVEQWTREVADSMTSPAIVEGMIIVGTDEGHLVAFGERSAASASEGRP